MVQGIDVELLDDERLVGEARRKVEWLTDDDPLLSIDDYLKAAQGSDFFVQLMQIYLNTTHFRDFQSYTNVAQKVFMRFKE
jgi:hypothetical protein